VIQAVARVVVDHGRERGDVGTGDSRGPELKGALAGYGIEIPGIGALVIGVEHVAYEWDVVAGVRGVDPFHVIVGDIDMVVTVPLGIVRIARDPGDVNDRRRRSVVLGEAGVGLQVLAKDLAEATTHAGGD